MKKLFLLLLTSMVQAQQLGSPINISTAPATAQQYTIDPSVSPLPGDVKGETFILRSDGNYHSTVNPGLWLSPGAMTQLIVSTQTASCPQVTQ